MTITKFQLVDALSSRLSISKQEATATVESLLETIKLTFVSGQDIMISGFGKFCVKKKKERRGRNPATGEDMMMNARRIVTFKCSNLLKDRMNGKDKP